MDFEEKIDGLWTGYIGLDCWHFTPQMNVLLTELACFCYNNNLFGTEQIYA